VAELQGFRLVHNIAASAWLCRVHRHYQYVCAVGAAEHWSGEEQAVCEGSATYSHRV